MPGDCAGAVGLGAALSPLLAPDVLADPGPGVWEGRLDAGAAAPGMAVDVASSAEGVVVIKIGMRADWGVVVTVGRGVGFQSGPGVRETVADGRRTVVATASDEPVEDPDSPLAMSAAT